MKHKWRKGEMPQLCENCGLIRTRQTFKYLMAISNKPPYNHYKYESKVVYKTGEMTIYKAPPGEIIHLTGCQRTGARVLLGSRCLSSEGNINFKIKIMAKLTLGHQLKVEWEKIYLEAQRALNYLEENNSRPVKSAHKILASNVKKSTSKIIKLTGASAGNGA